MEISKQIQKPSNWQDFERLCMQIWGEIWECKDTIKRHGRNGQPQAGVDIYAIPKNQKHYFGIQCKGKDDYTHKQLTKTEIDEEIEKAEKFEPALQLLIFATTANSSVEIEKYIRLKNEENMKKGLFAITVKFWDDIVDLLEVNQYILNWYLGVSGCSDRYDFNLSFDGDKSMTIKPIVIKKTIKHEHSTPIVIPKTRMQKIKSFLGFKVEEYYYPSAFNLFSMIDTHAGLCACSYSFCDVEFEIENTGNMVLEDIELYIYIDKEACDSLSLTDFTKYHNFDIEGYKSVASKTGIRKMGDNLYYSPINNKPLVQSAKDYFRVSFEPKVSATPTQFELKWDLKARNFSKAGVLIIKVEPIIEEEIEIRPVYFSDDITPDEVSYEHKIEYVRPF